LTKSGIRQCGKTSAVRELAKSFDNYIEVNFEKEPSLCGIFEGNLDIDRILGRLEIHFLKKIVPGKTLLFIDEIQECPRAITALRYFYEERRELHLVAAGSLLEFTLSSASSKDVTIDFPVGRVRSVFMYPFSFMEFLHGTGKGMLGEYLEELDIKSGDNVAHEQLIESYKTFLVVGGMPEAVSVYAETGSLLECQQIHRDIVLNFMDDFQKYNANMDTDTIRRVFDYALHNVCGQTKASSAVDGISAYIFDECISILRRAGLVYPVKASPCDTIPLGTAEKNTNKKLIVFDTGVYLTMCGLNVGELLSAGIFDEMNKGAVVEMQTGLELIKYNSWYSEANLYYWYRSGANAEVDYCIVKENVVVPIEVKASGKGSMQSMKSFLESHAQSPYGIRVSLENFGSYDKIRVYPVYAVHRLIKDKI
jgi:hypothetical protein